MQMSTTLEKLSYKRDLEAKWASEFLANGAVTVEMVRLNKEIEKVAQELKEETEQFLLFFDIVL